MHRTIREEPAYADQIARLKIHYKRLDEALDAATFVLARKPETFPLVPGTTLRRLKVNPYPGLPLLSIYFIFDDEEVRLLHADLMEEEEGEEE